MALQLIAVSGSQTTHGATLIAALQTRESIHGAAVLVAGDGAYCPKCHIVSQIMPRGSQFNTVDGLEIAFMTSRLTCGAQINAVPQSLKYMDDSA